MRGFSPSQKCLASCKPRVAWPHHVGSLLRVLQEHLSSGVIITGVAGTYHVGSLRVLGSTYQVYKCFVVEVFGEKRCCSAELELQKPKLDRFGHGW